MDFPDTVALYQSRSLNANAPIWACLTKSTLQASTGDSAIVVDGLAKLQLMHSNRKGSVYRYSVDRPIMSRNLTALIKSS